jgi:hypothetical protein
MCGVSRKENAMEATKKTKPPVLYIVRTIFLGIVLLAGLFWTWFGIASGIAEGGGILGTFMHTLMPGLVLLGITYVAWRWPIVGGVLLIAMGGAFAVFFNQFNKLNIYVLGLVVAPVVVAGLVLLFTKQPMKQDTSTST